MGLLLKLCNFYCRFVPKFLTNIAQPAPSPPAPLSQRMNEEKQGGSAINRWRRATEARRLERETSDLAGSCFTKTLKSICYWDGHMRQTGWVYISTRAGKRWAAANTLLESNTKRRQKEWWRDSERMPGSCQVGVEGTFVRGRKSI